MGGYSSAGHDLRVANSLRRLRQDSNSTASVKRLAVSLAASLMERLPSNYPQTLTSNEGGLYRAIAEEFLRYNDSFDGIVSDRQHDTVRPEFLYQNLASYLLLGTRALKTSDLGEEAYRSFLIKVRKACQEGSTVDNIQKTVAAILGLPVVLREAYRSARLPGSSYGIADTHRMFCDLLMDKEAYGEDLSPLLADLSFFLSMVKPAHVLVETRLVWEDSIGVCGRSDPSSPLSDANGSLLGYSLSGPSVKAVVRAVVQSAGAALDPVTLASDVGSPYSTGWVPGVLTGVSLSGISITVDGETLPLNIDTVLYTADVDGPHRAYLSELGALVGNTVWCQAVEVGGSPTLLYDMTVGATGPSLLARDLVLRPVFSEYAAVAMDPTGRFPELVSKPTGALHDRVVQDVLEPVHEDFRGNHTYPDPSLVSCYAGGAKPDQATYLSAAEVQVPYFPMLSRSGGHALPTDVTAYVDGELVEGLVVSLVPETGRVTLLQGYEATAEVRLDYHYAARYPERHTHSYVETGSNMEPKACRLFYPYRGRVQVPDETPVDVQVDKIPMLDHMGNLVTPSDVLVEVGGVSVEVVDTNPLLGHVRLAQAPAKGDTVSVSYFYTDRRRVYPLVPDQDGYTLDSEYGAHFGYELVPDAEYSDQLAPVTSSMTTRVSQYKYRAFALSGTTVLNSEDSFLLGDVLVPACRGSFASSGSLAGAAELAFSPEYLEDRRRYLSLDDDYLDGDQAPTLVLPEGTPSFEKTFTSTSGLVRSVPFSEFMKDGATPMLYSSLREVLTLSGIGGLTSPCEDSRDMELSVRMEEEYFPNREMRLNDYLDFVAKTESTMLDDGSIAVIKGSRVVKAVSKSVAMVPVGSTLVVSQAAGGDHRYTVADVVNSDTMLLTEPVSLPSGTYRYDNVMDSIGSLGVTVGAERRTLPLDLSMLAGTTGTWIVPVTLPDPDNDPYPYSPPNTGSTAVVSVKDAQDYHGHTGLYGNTGLPMSSSDADKMVKWRNWDQDVAFVTYLGATGVSQAAYPTARIRPGANGPLYDLLCWDIYFLGTVGVPKGATGVFIGYTGQVSPGHGAGGVTGSLPASSVLELVDPGTFGN